MLIVELIPLNKGNQVTLDQTNITTIGRTPTIGCLDNKISRNHAQLFIKYDGTVWIKAIHHNPTFYKTKTNQIVTLTKDKEYQLYNNDEFGLLPDEYFYRVSIKLKDTEIKETNLNGNQIVNSSVIPKSSIEISTHKNHDKEISKAESNVNLRTLSTWISDSSPSTSQQDKSTTTPVVKKQTYIEEKQTKGIVYDDDDHEESATSSKVQADTSNNIVLTTDNRTSSAVVNPIKRERCPFGESCYRTNIVHRQQAIHPDDPDWDTKEDDNKQSKPECPYGSDCYRKNPDHFHEYYHSKKKCIEIKTRTTKRTVSEVEDDEYLDTDTTNDEEDSIESDNDIEWKPDKNSRYADETDDDSSEDSERELTNQEASHFVKGSTADHHHHHPVIKKPRRQEEDDD